MFWKKVLHPKNPIPLFRYAQKLHLAMPSMPMASQASMCQKCKAFLSMLRNLWFLTSQTDILDEAGKR